MSPKAARALFERHERRLGLVGIRNWDPSKIDVGELDNVNQNLRILNNLCIAIEGEHSVSAADFAFAVSSIVVRTGMVLDRQLAAAQAGTLDWADKIV
jgi:hypothetical protein